MAGHGVGPDRTAAARRLWVVLEPVHALTYFAPEALGMFEAAGFRGFWRGYFAGRSAPLRSDSAAVVAACCFAFHPDFVARAIPSVWKLGGPDEALAARLGGAGQAMARLVGDDVDDVCREPAALLRDAFAPARAGGRTLFAANAALVWPEQPRQALWHAATLLREHRGDGHVAALLAAGLDPCEAHVLRVVGEGGQAETLEPYRGWTSEDWAAAADRLRDRGVLGASGVTSEGLELRREVESTTDRLASELVADVDDDTLDLLTRRLAPIAARISQSGEIPYPNPIGVPPPDA